MFISATRNTQPTLQRSANSSGEDLVVLSGLEAGRYRVWVDTMMSLGPGTEREVLVDGVNDVELDPEGH
jgi:hypothetical protein